VTCPPPADPKDESHCTRNQVRSDKEAGRAPKKKFTPEEIIGKLREAEVLLSQGQPIEAVCRGLGISEQTYYCWRKEYGGLRTDQAYRQKELERENARLKKLVADLALDKAILNDARRCSNFVLRNTIESALRISRHL
jgi:putative transposase